MSEHDEQKTFFDWVRLNRWLAPSLEVRKAMKLCYSVPNGAHMGKAQAGKMLAEGMTKGILDINLDWPVIRFDCRQWSPISRDVFEKTIEIEGDGLGPQIQRVHDAPPRSARCPRYRPSAPLQVLVAVIASSASATRRRKDQHTVRIQFVATSLRATSESKPRASLRWQGT